MSTVVKDLGAVSAYAYAVEKGYTGTEAEFAELMASYADVGQTAVDAKDAAVAAKTAAETAATTATNKATEATTAAQTATTKAGEASQSASQASTSAQTASNKASEASQSASTASTKAGEAAQSASDATTAKNDAVSAKTAAETAQGKAETAQEAAEDAAESVSASAAQIKTNKEDISELKSGFTNALAVPYTTNNGYINIDGTTVTHDYYVYTDYIECGLYDLYVRTYVKNDSSRIAFYDATKNFISAYNPYADNNKSVLLDKPDGTVYVRISCWKENASVLDVKYGNVGVNSQRDIAGLKSVVADVDESVSQIIERSRNILPINPKNDTVNNVVVYYNDGAFTLSGTATSNGGRTLPVTPYFALEKGMYSFTCYTDDGKTNTPYFFIQKSVSAYITSVGHKKTVSFTVDEPTTAYIGVNVIKDETYDFTYYLQIEKGTPTEFQTPSFVTAVDEVARTKQSGLNRFWSYAMSKILCIGDSLTSGANYTGTWNGASIDQNYPRILGRMLDAEVTNAGVSGITASGWYKDEISKYTLADYDAFIIWLGTNYGLTDTLDTDVNPYSDYNDYADTHTGNYCKIIEKIKADKPSSLIVLVKIFATSGSMGAKVANEVIDKIAVKYGLPVIDNSGLTSSVYPNLHGNINNPHFSKAGNIFLANRFVTGIGSIIADNPTIADFGETARTN